MRRFILALLIVLSGATVTAQPAAPVLCWNHDQVNFTSFTIQVDSGTATDVGLPTQAVCTAAGDDYGVLVSSLSLTTGAHIITIRACNGVDCTAATALQVVKL